jgi:hypothetical protein
MFSGSRGIWLVFAIGLGATDELALHDSTRFSRAILAGFVSSSRIVVKGFDRASAVSLPVIAFAGLDVKESVSSLSTSESFLGMWRLREVVYIGDRSPGRSSPRSSKKDILLSPR